MSLFSPKALDEGNGQLFATRRPVTLIPPIRLNIQDVEKALQLDYEREMQLQPQPLGLLNPSRKNMAWLPLFDSARSTNESEEEKRHDVGEPSGDKSNGLGRQLVRISLKRIKPISLFETSKCKIQKTTHDTLEIVLDKQKYIPLFQRSLKWHQSDNAVVDHEQIQPSTENQSQQQLQEKEAQTTSLGGQEQQQCTIDILEEVLGETDYNARSRIIIPPTKRRDASYNKKKTSPSSTMVTRQPPSSTSSSPPPVSPSEPSTSAELKTVHAIQQATTSSSPAPAAPATAPAAAPVTTTATATTTPTSTQTHPASLLLPPVQSKSTTIADTTTTPAKSTDTSLPTGNGHTAVITKYSIPRQSVPVFGTPLQYTAVQQVISSLNNFTAGTLKHHIGKMLDILNHPMIALLLDYTDLEENYWDGSGKTLLLQQLFSRLECRTQAFNLAIVCYDINAEEFLMNLIKPRYPVQRLNTVKKDEWDQEYGIIVKIKKNQPTYLPKSTFSANVDLAIIMDIRVQPNDPVMDMLKNSDSSGPPPIISLVTNRSVELRLQEYISKLSPPKWRLPDQAICPSLFDTKNDSPVENSGLVNYMVVDSVIRWIDSGMKNDYQFANDQSITPQADLDTRLTAPPSPSPRATPEEHQQQNGTQAIDQAPLRARSASPEKSMTKGAAEEAADATEVQSLQDDLAKLFSHVSLERLQHDLNLYKSNQAKSLNQHYTNRSDDEDSFYSAKSDSLSVDNSSSKVQAVIDSLQGTFVDVEEATRSSDMLKSMKLEFDKKCLSAFQSLVSSYQQSMAELQQEYAAEVEKKLSIR